jgi:soluble lytic murein transglycosylase-like protein
MRAPAAVWRAALPRLGLALLALVLCGQARACWQDAADRYGVNASLLYAIARTESQLNPLVVSRPNSNGTYDIGLMQINSSWLPTLRRYGIDEKQLLDACTSIHVGAWILSQNMRRLGNSWDAVGAYNAADRRKRLAYALKVYRNLPPEAGR